ncbi:MAG: HD domain-containing protein [Candidatus Omnitrophota bacterium]
MNASQVLAVQTWYREYVARFQIGGRLPSRSLIKHEHCLRVSRESSELSRDLGWSGEAVLTAEILGLLHDVGRFSQLAEYGTFVDRDSVDHAQRGLEVLEEEKVMEVLFAQDREVLAEGIRWHNKKAVPGSLPAEAARFVRLVRDADKLDGFRILSAALADPADPLYREIFCGKTLQGKADPGLVEQILRGQMISYADTHCLADYLLLQIGWIFDIHYDVSMRRVLERGIPENFPAYLPGDKGMEAAARAAADFRDRFLKRDSIKSGKGSII